MCESETSIRAQAAAGRGGGGAVQRDPRAPAAFVEDLDVGPADAAAEAGPERLQDRLLGGKRAAMCSAGRRRLLQ